VVDKPEITTTTGVVSNLITPNCSQNIANSTLKLSTTSVIRKRRARTLMTTQTTSKVYTKSTWESKITSHNGNKEQTQG